MASRGLGADCLREKVVSSGEEMMSFARLLLIPIWVGAFWGSLQFHHLDLPLGHGLCGPWGCGPPLEAAIGFHLFWLTIFVPPTVGLGLFLTAERNRQVGRIIFTVGVCLTAAIVGYDVISHAIQSKTIDFMFRRGLLTLVNTIDVPMMQSMLAGVVLYRYFGRKQSNASETSAAFDSAVGVEEQVAGSA